MQSNHIKPFSKPTLWLTSPSFLRVSDPTNGTNQLTQIPPRYLQPNRSLVAAEERANPTSRPFVPAALDILRQRSSNVVNLSHIQPTLSRMSRLLRENIGRTDAAQRFAFTRSTTKLLQSLQHSTWLPPSFCVLPAQASVSAIPAQTFNVTARPAKGFWCPPLLFDCNVDFRQTIGALRGKKEKAKPKIRHLTWRPVLRISTVGGCRNG